MWIVDFQNVPPTAEMLKMLIMLIQGGTTYVHGRPPPEWTLSTSSTLPSQKHMPRKCLTFPQPEAQPPKHLPSQKHISCKNKSPTRSKCPKIILPFPQSEVHFQKSCSISQVRNTYPENNITFLSQKHLPKKQLRSPQPHIFTIGLEVIHKFTIVCPYTSCHLQTNK